ncbi:MAG: stage II sporulation protein M [Candidatus Altiarchaeota archaeon]
MVLESLVVPESMECHPSRMIPVGFLYATVGLLLAYFIFGDYASMSAIFLTTMPLIVVIFDAIKYEECKDMGICKEYVLIKEHMRAVMLFVYLFLGLFLAYSFWFAVLPTEISTSLFNTQIETINAVRASFKASATGYAVGRMEYAEVIFFKNLSVLGLCILFSFIYGAGAIYILTWNASVIGVAAGQIIDNTLHKFTGLSGVGMAVTYIGALPVSMIYLVHGIPEVAAYFIGALGGGIISVAVANHQYKSKEFRRIVMDSIDLILLSVLVLAISALVEVYVTPSFF